MPDPSDYDDRTSFMEACVPVLIDEGNDRDQAVAICSSMWERRDSDDEDEDDMIEIVDE